MIDPTTPQKFVLISVALVIIAAAASWFCWKIICAVADAEQQELQEKLKAEKKPTIKKNTTMTANAMRKIKAENKAKPKKAKTKAKKGR